MTTPPAMPAYMPTWLVAGAAGAGVEVEVEAAAAAVPVWEEWMVLVLVLPVKWV